VPSSKNSIDLILAAALVAVVGLVVWQLRSGVASEPPVAVGTPLPPLTTVEGWINVPAGETVDVAGEIVVVDCWATYCGQCLTDLPVMVELASTYRPLGVKFIGATQETARDLPIVKQVVKNTPGFDWPVAYGASDFQNTMGFTSIPAVMLVGRDGRILWSGWGVPGLSDALDAALAADPTAGDESG
jgi:thiol-disulfide isomerase/thioredoxin